MGAIRASRRPPARETNRSEEDWYGEDISELDLNNVLLKKIDMTEVENRGAIFTDCTFRECRFNASTHQNAAFLNCTFAGCSFYDAQITGCKVIGSLFDRCNFAAVRITGGNWSMTELRGADLRSAVLVGMQMREADLSGANFQDRRAGDPGWIDLVSLLRARARGHTDTRPAAAAPV